MFRRTAGGRGRAAVGELNELIKRVVSKKNPNFDAEDKKC